MKKCTYIKGSNIGKVSEYEFDEEEGYYVLNERIFAKYDNYTPELFKKYFRTLAEERKMKLQKIMKENDR